MIREISSQEFEECLMPYLNQGYQIQVQSEDTEGLYLNHLKHRFPCQNLYYGLLDLPGSYLVLQCGGVNHLAAVEVAGIYSEEMKRKIVNFLNPYKTNGFEIPIIEYQPNRKMYFLFHLVDSPPGSFSKFSIATTSCRLIYGSHNSIPFPLEILHEDGLHIREGNITSIPYIDFKDYGFTENLFLNHSDKKFLLKNNATVASIFYRYQFNDEKESSETEQSIITSLLIKGFIESEIWDCFVLNKPRYFSGLFLTDPKKTDEYLKYSIGNAYRYLEENTNDIQEKINHSFKNTFQIPWPGKDGPNKKAVYLAHLLIAHRCNKLEYTAAVRELAEMAGVGDSTVSRVNKQLAQEGFLQQSKPEQEGQIFSYKIEDIGTYSQVNNIYRYLSMNDCAIILAHDSFRRDGLGKSCWDVWMSLYFDICSVSEIVERTGRHPTTVRKCLERMSEINDSEFGWTIKLVEKMNQGDDSGCDIWSTRNHSFIDLLEDLDRIAITFKTYGLGEAQKEKHQAQRAIFNELYREKGGEK